MTGELSLIVAMARGRVIGKGGTLPWHVPEDLRHFKATTMGHAMIMGRRTYDSIGRALPGRRSIVVSRRAGLELPGCEVAPSLEAAVDLARATDPSPVVIGGATLYEAALPLATRIYLTEIDRAIEGDTRFPDLDRASWREVERRAGETPEVTFVTLERIAPVRPPAA